MNDKNGQALAYNCVERARPIARLALARTRVHGSEVMFSVLVVVLRRHFELPRASSKYRFMF